MHFLKHFILTSVFMLFVSLSGQCDEATNKNLEQSIATLNKLKIQHFTLLRVVKNHKNADTVDEKAIKQAARFTANSLKEGELVFKYPGLLGAGWLTTGKNGYQLRMYADYGDFGDTAEPNPQYFIIYITKEGKIDRIFETPSLVK